MAGNISVYRHLLVRTHSTPGSIKCLKEHHNSFLAWIDSAIQIKINRVLVEGVVVGFVWGQVPIRLVKDRGRSGKGLILECPSYRS